LSAWDCAVRVHSPNGSPLIATTLSDSTMPQEVLPSTENLSQRIDRPLFRCDPRPDFPGAGGGAGQAEIFAQGLAGIVLLEQTAPLQFRNHVADEIGVGAGHMGGRDHEAVAAP